ncbi:hypothetical protein ALC62_06277, partial [Cyphomyrmex costatus]
FDSVIIIGKNVNLLVLLTALASSYLNIYLLKLGKSKIEQQIYSSTSLQVEKSVFNQGKIKLLNILRQNIKLNKIVKVFRKENADPHSIAKTGKRVLVTLYGYNDNVISFNNIRYQCFMQSVYKTKFNLASLPSTEDAARQHSLLRTYHQVQQWYGFIKNPEKWE